MKKQHEQPKNRRKHLTGLVLVVILLAAVCAAVCLLLLQPEWLQPEVPTQLTDPTETQSESAVPSTEARTEPAGTKPVQVDELEQTSISLDAGMRITDVGKYTGIYMEDGSDELVSGILMIAVTNEGTEAIQYAEITMPVGDKTASFSLTTLPVGGTVILLERSRMEYVAGEYTEAAASSVALFTEPMSLCEDRLQIQILDGAINVTNISAEDITGDVVIYYKNSASDVYYGGITYRVRLEGGIEAGEVRQIMASHFSESGSSVMFVTIGTN